MRRVNCAGAAHEISIFPGLTFGHLIRLLIAVVVIALARGSVVLAAARVGLSDALCAASRQRRGPS